MKIKNSVKTAFHKASDWLLASQPSQFLFKHSHTLSSASYAISDSFYLSKDLITGGSIASIDTLTGVFLLSSALPLKFAKSHPAWAFRAHGGFMFGAIGLMVASGMGYEFGGGGTWDNAKIVAGLGYLPGAVLTFFEDEIAEKAKLLHGRSTKMWSRFLTSVSQYPLVWTGAMNMVGVSGLLISGLQNPAQEWPMIGVAIAGLIGETSLMASDRRMAELHTKAVAAKNSLKPEMG